MRLWAGLAWLLPALCLQPAASPSSDWVKRSRPLLGTFVTITARGGDRESLQRSISAAFEEFDRVDRLMSVHRPDSELRRVNALAGSEEVVVSEELFHVLTVALEIARRTDGAFDISIHPLTELWGFIWKEHRLPAEAELRGVLPLVDYRQIELNAERRSVRFLKKGMAVDLGGIAKGFAVDLAIEKLDSLGVESALVKAGGDARVLGLPPGEEAWEIQLEDPQKEGIRTTVWIRSGALSTSGNYENFFVIDGRRYSHIVDPRTGHPVQGIAACTVTAPTCLESDAWATACTVYGVEESLRQFGDELGIRFTLVPETDGADEEWEIRTSAAAVFEQPVRK